MLCGLQVELATWGVVSLPSPGGFVGADLSCSRLQGVGRRYAHVVLRKADIDLTKRAGELTEDEVSGAPLPGCGGEGEAQGFSRGPALCT